MSWATATELADLADLLELDAREVTSTVVGPTPATPDGAGGYTRETPTALAALACRVERLAGPDATETAGGSRSGRAGYMIAVRPEVARLVEGSRIVLADEATVTAAIVSAQGGDDGPLMELEVVRILEVINPGPLGIARYYRCEATDTLSGE